MSVHVFHGPTIRAGEVKAVVPEAELHAPVEHGDLLRLDVRAGDTVVIIDGLFHNTGAVRHKEILDLLARQVRVVGASSMGALRAAELHPYGMVGIGWVFSAYRDGLIEADDEVAVTHTTDDFRQVCEPLVNTRYALELATAEGVISQAAADELLECARAVPYAARNWTMLRRTVTTAQPGLLPELDRLTDWQACRAAQTNIKRIDAVEALRSVANGRTGEAARSAESEQHTAYFGADDWRDGRWRSFFSHYWSARYRGRSIDGTHVPFLAELQHQQLYDPSFAGRWRAYALYWIAAAGLPDGEVIPDDEIEARALAAAERSGINVRDLEPERLRLWLSPAEIADLDDREQLARVLVRAEWSATVWPATREDAGDLLNPDVPSAAIAAQAFRLNKAVAEQGPRRSVFHLRADRIRAHLAGTWSVPPEDTAALAAAARDRGFDSLDGALAAARTFYLWATHRQPVPETPPADA